LDDFHSTAMSNARTFAIYVKTLLASHMVTTPPALAFLGCLVIPVILIFDFVAGTTL
jgi:hypothetical protein